MARSVRTGAVLPAAGVVQCFAAQLVVQAGWRVPFSWADDNISDLGNVHCGDWYGRSVCSPWHVVTNASFVLMGLLGAIGAAYPLHLWPVVAAVYRWRRPGGHRSRLNVCPTRSAP